MRKAIFTALMSMAAVVLSAPVVFAQEAEHMMAADHSSLYAYVALAAGLAIGLAALGTGIGQGIATNGAMHGISRNPGASGKIMTTMIIGLAMIESLAIYALVVSLILLYANPYSMF